MEVANLCEPLGNQVDVPFVGGSAQQKKEEDPVLAVTFSGTEGTRGKSPGQPLEHDYSM